MRWPCKGKSIEEIYQAITVEDIQEAADLFRPVYDRLEGADGFVSLEVSPRISSRYRKGPSTKPAGCGKPPGDRT